MHGKRERICENIKNRRNKNINVGARPSKQPEVFLVSLVKDPVPLGSEGRHLPPTTSRAGMSLPPLIHLRDGGGKQSAGADPLSKKMFVYSFVWPSGVEFNEPGQFRPNPPSYYLYAMRRSMEHLKELYPTARFRVHMHPACASVSDLLPGFEIVHCREDDHWLFPILHRSASLVSEKDDDAVIMIDGHDPPRDQAEAIEDLLNEMKKQNKTAGFTFWPGDGCSGDGEVPNQGTTLPQFKVYDRGQDDVRSSPWMVDCGLAITTSDFRRKLGIDYDAFLDRLLNKYSNVWTDFSATSDEAALDLALFKNSDSARIVKTSSVIQAHWLAASPSDFAAAESSSPPMPKYVESWDEKILARLHEMCMPAQDQSRLPASLKGVKLEWGTEPATLVVRKKAKTSLPASF